MFGICEEFVSNFIKFDSNPTVSIAVTICNKNPKAIGFHKIVRTEARRIKLGKKDFVVCWTEREVLDKLSIKVGDNFWVKIVKH